LLENKHSNKNSKDKNYGTKKYQSLDDVINDACLLSDLRKPPKNNTRTDKDGQTTKKQKMAHLSPILFVKVQIPSGKKKRDEKTRLIKALVDSGASETIIVKSAAKKLPLRENNEPKKWATAAGTINTTFKTKRVDFSFPELHANRMIKKSFHVVDIDLKRYDMIIGRDLIQTLGLQIKGNDLSLKWDDAAILTCM
jgi:predicted aspartyl protease